MPEVAEVKEQDDDVFIIAYDSIGRLFTLRFSSEQKGIDLDRIYLPEDITWNVEVFQEMVDVRDEIVEYIQQNELNLQDASFELHQIEYFERNPVKESVQEILETA